MQQKSNENRRPVSPINDNSQFLTINNLKLNTKQSHRLLGESASQNASPNGQSASEFDISQQNKVGSILTPSELKQGKQQRMNQSATYLGLHSAANVGKPDPIL